MNYSNINWIDDKNGDGCRLTLFVSGCPHKCEGCFNIKTWSYLSGDEYTIEIEDSIFAYFEKNKAYLKGLSILGGEPLAPRNVERVTMLLKRFKETYTDKDVWVWSGYTLEELTLPNQLESLKYIDTLVDGRYEESLRNTELYFRGSSNQRILTKNVHY
ncbi:anaerobic ribonucleoside-triphosphate reductase activating protein [Photobacterium kishitanii]|uniref:Anaerobic ribonucleoside-triphosphate reductase-activating protein n=1 Tax=Photobacterium kishitanii TaxID=318456 RepID=A0A2T3KMF5_9GAMM|nr:anaerobic ribonucleoside-triphosphate reductase activating protein [Photobacterium kishitanii]PSV00971.1 anaerobic ribonucleoside-triphosphate reductase activating protein [Photobacterium kishitanii]